MTTNSTKLVFGLNVRNIRLCLNLSQTTVAELAGVAQQRVAEIENGNLNVTLDTLDKLAFALGCQTEDLIQTRQSLRPTPGTV